MTGGTVRQRPRRVQKGTRRPGAPKQTPKSEIEGASSSMGGIAARDGTPSLGKTKRPDRSSLNKSDDPLQPNIDSDPVRPRQELSGASAPVIERALGQAPLNRVGAETGIPRAAVPSRAGLTFSRFLGLSRLSNWFYSSKEDQLIDLQKKVKESLDEIDDIYKNNSEYIAARKSEELLNIEGEIQQISNINIAKQNYADIHDRLEKLRIRLDNESTKQAILLGLDDTFSRGSPQTLPSKEEMIATIKEAAINASIKDAGNLRYLVDALSQWVSDAVLRIPDGAELQPLLNYKKNVAEAAALMNEAFFLGVVKRDHDTAKNLYQAACMQLQTIDFAVIAGPKDVKPKAREDYKTPFDPGAMMLAATLNDSSFVPHLLVGLPTGGTHAANKLSGALGVLKGARPVLWYTRPQGVKPESKALLEGIDDKQKFRPEEFLYLRDELRKKIGRGEKARILIVDDGATTGKTIELAREIYRQQFLAEFPGLEVRTATIKGGRQVEAEFLLNKRENPNQIDYVVNQTNDRVGRPSVLRTIEAKRDSAQIYGGEVHENPKVSLSTLVDIVSDAGDVRTVGLAKTLVENGG